MAKDPKVIGEVLSIVNRAISTHLLHKAGLSKKSGANTGSVTFIQRFGGSLNLNIHFHIMYLDGVYTFDKGHPQFHSITSPSQGELDKLLNRIAHRVVKFLEKKGLLVRDEMGQEYLSIEATQSMDQIQGASLTYKIALGKYKGKKALTLQSVPLMEKTKDKFLSRYAGFSLHCGVACPANDRKKLERVCRYISRPSLSEERLSLNTRGQVIYRLKNAYDNGTTHIVLDPLDFLSRLASLIPRPRANLTRFHGVFAPNSKYRTLVIPEAPPPQAEKMVASDEQESRKKKSHGMTWAQRLKRVFGIDIKMCGKCGGKVKVVAAIEKPAVIEKILKHLGLDWTAPQPSPSRGPP